jgi:hypothetical protein
MTFQQKEAALLRAMASAKSLKDQAVLAEELQTLRSQHQASLRDERDLQWADMVVEATSLRFGAAASTPPRATGWTR